MDSFAAPCRRAWAWHRQAVKKRENNESGERKGRVVSTDTTEARIGLLTVRGGGRAVRSEGRRMTAKNVWSFGEDDKFPAMETSKEACDGVDPSIDQGHKKWKGGGGSKRQEE